MSICNGLHCWWSGNQIDDAYLWGLKVVWWGRIGKLLEFLGGLNVVVDLIGPERILATGKRMQDRQAEMFIRARAQLAIGWARYRRLFRSRRSLRHAEHYATRAIEAGYRPPRGRSGPDKWMLRNTVLESARQDRRAAIHGVSLRRRMMAHALTLAIVGLSAWSCYQTIRRYLIPNTAHLATITLCCIVIALIWPPLYALLVDTLVALPTLIGAVTLLLTDRIVVHPLGRFLVHEGVGDRIKWMGVWSIVIGFVLDLLSS